MHVPPRWSPGRRPPLGGRGGALGPRGQGPGRSLVAAEVVRKRWGRPVQICGSQIKDAEESQFPILSVSVLI